MVLLQLPRASVEVQQLKVPPVTSHRTKKSDVRFHHIESSSGFEKQRQHCRSKRFCRNLTPAVAAAGIDPSDWVASKFHSAIVAHVK